MFLGVGLYNLTVLKKFMKAANSRQLQNISNISILPTAIDTFPSYLRRKHAMHAQP